MRLRLCSGCLKGALLSANLNRDQLWVASGVLDGLNRIFGRESSHRQRQLAIGGCLDGSPVNALHVFRSSCTAAIHSHKELRVGHGFLSRLRTKMVGAKKRFPT